MAKRDQISRESKTTPGKLVKKFRTNGEQDLDLDGTKRPLFEPGSQARLCSFPCWKIKNDFVWKKCHELNLVRLVWVSWVLLVQSNARNKQKFGQQKLKDPCRKIPKKRPFFWDFFWVIFHENSISKGRGKQKAPHVSISIHYIILKELQVMK